MQPAPSSLGLTFDDASQSDVEAISALHEAAALDLTGRFGQGHWSRAAIVRRVDPPSPFVRVRVGRLKGRVISALRLQTKKPWAIDASYFTPMVRPIYLTGMVVEVATQGSGIGRAAMDDAATVARLWPASAIRLDAYDAAAGAGSFYEKCGYVKRGHRIYRGTPLVYYELILEVS